MQNRGQSRRRRWSYVFSSNKENVHQPKPAEGNGKRSYVFSSSKENVHRPKPAEGDGKRRILVIEKVERVSLSFRFGMHDKTNIKGVAGFIVTSWKPHWSCTILLRGVISTHSYLLLTYPSKFSTAG